MMDEEALKRVLNDVLEERNRMDAEEHADHHHFINELIKERQRRQAIWDHVRENFLGWALIAFVLGIGGLVVRAIKQYLESGSMPS